MLTSDTSISSKAEFALKRPWLSWVEKDGSLVITVSDEPCYFVRILPWSMRMQCGVRSEWTEYGGAERVGWDWVSDYLDLTLLNREWEASHGLPVYKFAQAIPQQIRETFTPYTYYQSRLLQLISNHPEARDLAGHNPNILWLFAKLTVSKNTGQTEIRSLLRQRSEMILSCLLGKNVGKAAVKFLRKVIVTDGNRELFELLLSLLTDRDKIALLAHHWKRIPQAAIPLIVDNESQVLSRCLARELANSWLSECEAKILRVGRLWEDVQLLGNELGNCQSTRPEIMRLQSVSQMQQLHDRWTDKIIEQEMQEFLQSEQSYKPFPSSPLPGNPNIIQINNLRELLQESNVMRHCVFSRYKYVFQGDVYYYRMYWPERCTVEIQQVEGEWSVTELKLQSNEEPSSESWQYIWNWLDKAVTGFRDSLPLNDD